VGHVESVVQHEVGLIVRKAVKVPVSVTAEHDRRLLRGRDSNHLEVPGHVGQSVGDVRDNLSREALRTIGVDDGEGDAVVRVRYNGEVPPVPAIGTSMQRVHTLWVVWSRVLVGQDVVRHSVELEGAVLYAIGIAPWNTAKVRMLLVNAVVGGIVEAAHDVTLDSVLVIDKQIGDGRAIWDESRCDALSVDPVLAVLVWTRGRAV
jgi:hypothetical protein